VKAGAAIAFNNVGFRYPGGLKVFDRFSLRLQAGQRVGLVGQSGGGKSSLFVLLQRFYDPQAGSITIDGQDILGMTVDARARAGLFLAMQYPTAIPGVTMVNFLRAAIKAVEGRDVPVREFRTRLMDTLALIKMDEAFARRYVNDGFSGGEKKRAEILQMSLLKPIMAVMDETDSGLDIDALRTVSEGINALRTDEMGILLITHYQRILNYVQPDKVHVLYKGRIVRSGGPELALELEDKGYDWITREVDAAEVTVGSGGN